MLKGEMMQTKEEAQLEAIEIMRGVVKGSERVLNIVRDLGDRLEANTGSDSPKYRTNPEQKAAIRWLDDLNVPSFYGSRINEAVKLLHKLTDA